MSEKLFLYRLGAILFILIAALSANGDKKRNVGQFANPNFNPDISAFTSGVISKESVF